MTAEPELASGYIALIIIVVVFVVVAALISVCFCLYLKRKRQQGRMNKLVSVNSGKEVAEANTSKITHQPIAVGDVYESNLFSDDEENLRSVKRETERSANDENTVVRVECNELEGQNQTDDAKVSDQVSDDCREVAVIIDFMAKQQSEIDSNVEPNEVNVSSVCLEQSSQPLLN